MKTFLLLIREKTQTEDTSYEHLQELIQEHMAWIESLGDHFISGDPLEPGGIIISQNQEIDGPYVETKECVSGYYFLKASSLEEVKGLAMGCPDIKYGARIEIREIMNEG